MKLKGIELGILLICFCVLLISFFKTQENISFESSFHFPFHSLDSIYSNGHFPLPHELIPSPLIIPSSSSSSSSSSFDPSLRDSFNSNLFVFVDYHFNLYITFTSSLSSLNPSSIPNESLLNGLNIKKKVSLLSKGNVKTGRKPKGMKYGYLSKERELNGDFVIVIVTEHWNVLCFDSNLNLLWESNLQDHHSEMEKMAINEIAITISHHSVQKDDEGMIIIGGRSIPLRSADEQSKFEEEHGVVGQGGEHNLKDETEEYHFSYYCLDGKSGSLRWKHEKGDFYGEGVDQHDHSNQLKKMIPEHSYKLHLLSSHKHLGEMDWKLFKDDIMDHLPHQWIRREDTSFSIDHFAQKRNSGEGKLSSSSQNQRKKKEEAKENVLISHTKTGIEVLHLYTGRTVSTLRLYDGLYQDLNDDGIIDHAQAVQQLEGSHHHEKEKKSLCYALVSSGVPHLERLFNGSICESSRSSVLSVLDIFSRLQAQQETSVTNILTLPSSYSKTLIQEGGTEEFDVIFLISNGRMTSFRSDGRLNWQIDSDAIWNSSPSSDNSQSTSFDMREGIAPTLSSYSLYSNKENERKLILASTESLVLIDPHGNTWISQQLPSIPVSKPIIGDVDGDGMNDIIVVTPNGISAFRIRQSNTSGMILFVLSLFIIILSTLFYQSVSSDSQKSNLQKSSLKKQ
eukprot:TRINITY_DN1926_c0_g2_i1.p1 TRINITY_DN1926_c0_g2~~TRINITY_DN1926_c0_g2_i1.p1  ORF type:complete len:680 (-),score=268.00 TRINITY_DN1926_c0_g2_i1:43-2082(-)